MRRRALEVSDSFRRVRAKQKGSTREPRTTMPLPSYPDVQLMSVIAVNGFTNTVMRMTDDSMV